MAEERVQRRLAAILAADVVGYCCLMRDKEFGMPAQLGRGRWRRSINVGQYG